MMRINLSGLIIGLALAGVSSTSFADDYLTKKDVESPSH